MSNPEVTDQRLSTDAAADQPADVSVPAAGTTAGEWRQSAPGASTLPVWQSRRRPWWQRWLSAAAVWAIWIVALALGTLAALRLFYHDGSYLLVCLNAFTLYLYLPAYAVLAWAAWRRRWWLATASGLVVVCHLMWVGPDYLPATRSAPPPPGAAAPSPTMRIFFANVLATNTEFDSMLREIADADPDVVMLVEYSGRWHRALKDSPVMAPYVYRQRSGRFGQIGYYSRLPIVDAELPPVTNRFSRILTVQLGDDLVRLFCLHGPRPMDYPWYDYDGYWKQMLPLIDRQPDPLIVVGDFNATQHSSVYEALTAGRLRSAHQDRGRGYATTWPNGRYWFPPIRIDQALVSPEVECLDISEGLGRGSDHKPVILDVRIRHDRPAAEGDRQAAAG